VTLAHVNGVDLYYELRGVGPPLLLIPGLGSDVRMFRPVIDGLTRRCQVLAFDPRGAGRSDKPDIPYSMGMMADDAAGLLQAVDIPSAHVLGYSMGGRIALQLALGQPHRVKSLILASTSARTLPSRPGTWRWVVMDLLPRLPLPRRIDPQPRSANLRQRGASRDYDCTDRLADMRVPALIVHGRRDRITPYALALELHQGIPGSQFVTVKGGHFALITHQRARLIEAVTDFVP
jgi:pimeloyl-ACP methyl ester carboxylesterase